MRPFGVQLNLVAGIGVFEFVLKERVVLGELDDVCLGHFENGRVFRYFGEFAGKPKVVDSTIKNIKIGYQPKCVNIP